MTSVSPAVGIQNVLCVQHPCRQELVDLIAQPQELHPASCDFGKKCIRCRYNMAPPISEADSHQEPIPERGASSRRLGPTTGGLCVLLALLTSPSSWGPRWATCAHRDQPT